MSSKSYKIWLLLVLAVVMISRGGRAQRSCSSNSMLNSLSSCISYLRGNSSRPLPSCCSSLATVVQSQPDCLCPVLTSGATSTLGIAINRTLAMALPSTCKLQTPQCDDAAADGPTSFPALSPLSPPSTASSPPPPTTPPPTAPPFDNPSGSKTVKNNAGCDGNGETASIYLQTITILIASWTVGTHLKRD